MRRTLAVYTIISLFVSLSYGQKKYILDGYEIDPVDKTVSVLTGFNGTKKDGMHFWGQRYVLDSTINYNSTKLFVIGNQFVFQEHILDNWSFPSHLDLNTLKVIRIDLEDFGSICRDNNYLYRNSIGLEKPYKWESIELSGYETINDYIYKKKNQLYFLSKDFELKKIEGVKLHVSTLRHIMGNYFADKNGLYLLGGYITQEHKAEETDTGLIIWRQEWADDFYGTSVQLEKSKGKKIVPVIKRDYFIYGNSVYSPTHANNTKPLPLDVEKVKELEITNSRYGNYRISFLADDEHTFVTQSRNQGYVTLETRFNNHWFKNNDFFEKNVNQWAIVAKRLFKDDGSTIYFPSEIKPGIAKEYVEVLIERQNEFYIFNTDEKDTLQKSDHIFIFNFDTQEYEELDFIQYRYLSEHLWIYKNRLYTSERGLPTKETIDTDHLRFITHHNVKTNYLTNDKSLVYMGNKSGHSTLGEGGNRMEVLGNRIISEVDFSTLKVITADILTDHENIYIGDYSGITAVPIKALGLDIKIFTE